MPPRLEIERLKLSAEPEKRADVTKSALPTPENALPILNKMVASGPPPPGPTPAHKTHVAAPNSITSTNEITVAAAVPGLYRKRDLQESGDRSREFGASEAGTDTPIISGPTGIENTAAGSSTGVSQGVGSLRDVVAPIPKVATGNIGPYRKDLQRRLQENWHPQTAVVRLVVLITIAQDGSLISTSIMESSGSKRADREALQAVNATSFAPLPAWYKGDLISFRIEMIKTSL